MIHLNQHIRENDDLWKRFCWLCAPEIYLATSVRDFIDSSDGLKTGRFYQHHSGLCWVRFSNVDLTSPQENLYFISDQSGKIYAFPLYNLLSSDKTWKPHMAALPKNLQLGKHYMVLVRVKPEKGWIYLHAVQKHGPAQAEPSPQSLESLLQPCLA